LGAQQTAQQTTQRNGDTSSAPSAPRAPGAPITPRAASRPNLVVFLTDDQDVDLGGFSPLAKTHQHLSQKGMSLSNAYASTPICCPSRASILTGRYMHNTEVLTNSVSGGCSSKAWRDGQENKSFAAYLQKAGYVTMYAGKYLNEYGKAGAGGGNVSHIPKGWDFWAGLVGNSRYYNYTLSSNGKPEHHKDNYTKDYLTDVIRRKAIQFLSQYSSTSQSSPFLMVLSPPAAHAPFTPAPQYANHFPNQTAPRTKAFNIKEPDGSKFIKHWLLQTKPEVMDAKTIEKVDQVFRNRLRTLLSVDDLVGKVVNFVESHALSHNTYFFFTSDHGYHLGQFGMPIDKRLPYEFDLRVPMVVRGPGIPANTSTDSPVVLIDLAPTLLDLAGVEVPATMDGLSFASLLKPNSTNRVSSPSTVSGDTLRPVQETGEENLDQEKAEIVSNVSDITSRDSFLVEYTGEGSARSSDTSCGQQLNNDLPNLAECSAQFGCKCQDSKNNTYACVRTISAQENTVFCQFEDGKNFTEMYNLKQDPAQLMNLATLLQKDTLDHYQKLLAILKNCKGPDCNQT